MISERFEWKNQFIFTLAEIVNVFRKAGFFIMARKTHKLTAEQVGQLQHAHHGKDYYDELVNYMTRWVNSFRWNTSTAYSFISDASELLVLVKEDASKSWQELVGPEDPATASETAPTRYVSYINGLSSQNFLSF